MNSEEVSGALPSARARALRAEPATQSQAEPLVPNAVLLVLLCDESGRRACCQDIALVADAEAFAAYAKCEFAGAKGTPDRGYDLYGKNGEDLNFTLVTMRYEVLTAQAIEARRAATGTGAVHESAVPQGCAQTPIGVDP